MQHLYECLRKTLRSLSLLSTAKVLRELQFEPHAPPLVAPSNSLISAFDLLPSGMLNA